MTGSYVTTISNYLIKYNLQLETS